MKPKTRRLCLILGTLGSMACAAVLLLIFFQDAVLFFYTPSQLMSKSQKELSRSFRLGGLVKKGSVRHCIVQKVPSVTFEITDGKEEMRVIYTGVLPDLFREGQGIVAQGHLIYPESYNRENEKVFQATTVLAKHDENYMPPDLEKGLSQISYQSLEESLDRP